MELKTNYLVTVIVIIIAIVLLTLPVYSSRLVSSSPPTRGGAIMPYTQVEILNPLIDEKFDQYETINIMADIECPIFGCRKVFAEVTFPDMYTTKFKLKSSGDSIFQGQFIQTEQTGDYNVRIIANPYIGYPNKVENRDFYVIKSTTCNDCEDCSAKLNGDWDKVTLVESIDNHGTTCITFGANNVVFDGGKDKGIYIGGAGPEKSGTGGITNILNKDGFNIGEDIETLLRFYNMMSAAYSGIRLNGYSGTVQNSEVKEFDMGIDATDSSSSIIKDNHVHHNHAGGIWLQNGNSHIVKENIVEWTDMDGIGIAFSNHNTIENNVVQINSNNGFWIYSSYNTIKNNDIFGNGDSIEEYGINILSGESNNIFNNNIKSNFYNAVDAGIDNIWYDDYPVGGNYWTDFDETGEGCYDDYSGPDQIIPGSDGICDSMYPSGISDSYPYVTESGWM